MRQRGVSDTDDGREDHPFGVKHSKIERSTQNMVIQGGDAPKEHRETEGAKDVSPALVIQKHVKPEG